MASDSIQEKIASCTLWPERFAPEEWSIYREVISEANRRGLGFAVGGGLAAMTYAGQWRSAKDLDLYILPVQREEAVRLVSDLGLVDYYQTASYDRAWIYRSCKGDVIVDLIWAMANQRAVVDETWLEGPEVEVAGERFRLLGVEEELWSKIYILQRDRTDWPEILNLLYSMGAAMDWCKLKNRLGSDMPLLAGVLSVFNWICPEQAAKLPLWLWSTVGLAAPRSEALDFELMRQRARLLDSRPWFTPTLDSKM